MSRVAGLTVTVPRFSNVAFVSVLVLIASGTGATIIHMPTVAALWQTSYGKTILVKIGLLLAAMVLAAFNLLRTKPQLDAARERPELGPPAAKMLRRLGHRRGRDRRVRRLRGRRSSRASHHPRRRSPKWGRRLLTSAPARSFRWSRRTAIRSRSSSPRTGPRFRTASRFSSPGERRPFAVPR